MSLTPEHSIGEHSKLQYEMMWQKDPVLSNFDYTDLPTTQEIAIQGILDSIEFQKLFPQLDKYMKRLDGVFFGVSPEQGSVAGSPLNTLSTEDQKRATDFLAKRKYLVITEEYLSPELSRYKKWYERVKNYLAGKSRNICSIINLQAAQRVIELDRQRGDNSFPENMNIVDLDSIARWLKANPREWQIGKNSSPMANRRLGLLSGYPHRSVKAFDTYHQEGQRLSADLIQLGIDQQIVISAIYKDEISAWSSLLQYKVNIPEELWQRLEKRKQYVVTGEFLACDQADADWRQKVLSIQDKIYKLLNYKA